MRLYTFMFAWNGRRRFIDAFSESEAIDKFQEKYGFHPTSTEGMTITQLED